MMENIRIRRMEYEDIPQVVAIEKDSFKHSYPPLLIMQILSSFPEGFLVAEDERSNKVVGYIMGLIEWGHGHIVSIATSKDYRNRGIGTVLLKELENILFKKYNVGYIVLEVRFNNRGARRFYYKRGYMDKRLLPRYYEDGTDAILMVKRNPYIEVSNTPVVVSMW